MIETFYGKHFLYSLPGPKIEHMHAEQFIPRMQGMAGGRQQGGGPLSKGGKTISEAVVRRLPVYLQVLNELHIRDIQTVSSGELGRRLELNPAQIRKDLAYFGEFGRKGVGYDVNYLIEKIRGILKLDQPARRARGRGQSRPRAVQLQYVSSG